MGKPVAFILMQPQMSADTEVSLLSCEEHTVAIDGLLSLSGGAMSPNATTNLTSKTGQPKATTMLQKCISKER